MRVALSLALAAPATQDPSCRDIIGRQFTWLACHHFLGEERMNNAIAVPRRWTYWVIAFIALVWNLIGLAMFFVQARMTPEMIAAMPPEQQQVYAATPAWLNVAFGVAVVAGVLGSLCLLLSKRWAIPLFLVSLLAIVVQMVGAYAFTPAWQAYGPAGLAMPVMLVVIALYLWWYARSAKAKGWLN